MIDYTPLKKNLEEKLAQIVIELSEIAKQDESTGDWVAIPDAQELKEADENSEADAVEEWNERQATVFSLETLYRHTKIGLEKIETGTYGVCEICNQPIESSRLDVLLTARTCMKHMDDERTLAL